MWLTQPNTYTWRPVGSPLEVPTSKARGITARLNLLGCVDFLSGEVQYREVQGNTTSEEVIQFFDVLAEQSDPECPTLVLLDQASIHTCKRVLLVRESWKERGLWVVYLPAYSPELNLMEGEWRQLKYHRLAERHQRNKDALRDAIRTSGWGKAV